MSEPRRLLDSVKKTMETGRQQTYRAYKLEVKFADGRSSEGFAWAWYSFHRFETHGNRDKLTILFTHRAVIITGHQLALLIPKIEDESLIAIQEMGVETFERALTLADEPLEGEPQPLIESIKTEPPFEDLIANLTMKEEPDGHQSPRTIDR